VNDQFGHQVGDQVLTEITEILAKGIRRNDVLGRWGGEEFIIISTDTDLSGAMVLAEKLRVMIESHVFRQVGKKTCSFGVSQLRKNETIDALLIRSDQALYRAKSQGRNRVVAES
jgi:diguanylate cyclase (GGDEF)-like protein